MDFPETCVININLYAKISVRQFNTLTGMTLEASFFSKSMQP